jgi:hypothetical protein
LLWFTVAQRRQRAIDGFVDGVPLRRRALLQRRFRFIPGRFEVLDPSLRPREVALVDQGGCVDDDGAERGEVTELGCGGRLGRSDASNRWRKSLGDDRGKSTEQRDDNQDQFENAHCVSVFAF